MILLLSNPLVDAYRTSDLFGKAIFLSLFLLSIVTWIIFLQKFFYHRTIKKKGVKLQTHFQKKRIEPLSIEIKHPQHPYAHLYQTLRSNTLELLKKNQLKASDGHSIYLSHSDIDLIGAHLSNTVSEQTKRLEKNLFILSTIVSLAPFLGLLGTVWGILLTFSELQTGATVNASATVMGGLAMALGTTVLGLLVAIPALIGYNYLKAATATTASDMEDFSHLMVASVELHYRQIEVS